jgi:hypothetical protein
LNVARGISGQKKISPPPTATRELSDPAIAAVGFYPHVVGPFGLLQFGSQGGDYRINADGHPRLPNRAPSWLPVI